MRARGLVALTFLAACGGGAAPDPARNEAVVRAFIEAMNADDYAAIDTLLTEGYARHGQATAGDVVGRAAFVAYLRDEDGAFPDARLEIGRLVTEGDEVAFWGTYTATQSGPAGAFPSRGRAVALDVAGVHRLEGGRVAETWVTWDNLAGLAQLGHWDPRPFAPGEADSLLCAVRVPIEPDPAAAP